MTVRLTRHGDAVRVQFETAEGRWQMARLAPFSGAAARIGPMCCSPERAGFRARFLAVSMGPPIARGLHD
jgi:regulation of enolase protein 1 (concanavalin A-like superfamily)